MEIRLSKIVAAVLAVLAMLGVGIVFRMTDMNPWLKFDGTIENYIEVRGDPNAPPKHWYNHFQLATWGWKRVVMIEVMDRDLKGQPLDVLTRGYHAGYQDRTGNIRIDPTVSHSRYFVMKVGREDTIFFAVPVGRNKATRIQWVADYGELH